MRGRERHMRRRPKPSTWKARTSTPSHSSTRTWGVSMKRSKERRERWRGLLLAARGRLDEAAAALERGVRSSDPLGQPLILGRALLAQGMVARRAKRKHLADKAFGSAERVFEGAGMALLAERSRAE